MTFRLILCMTLLVGLLGVIGLPATVGFHDTLPPAFPGAEGYGATAVGGRGGRVFEVTNLNDSGAGSLREAIEAEGPRTVIFKVAGTITLLSSLKVTNPYLTIAGQSAPGDGITLRNDPSNRGPTLHIQTHDVVVRFIRLRSGPSAQPSCCVDSLLIYQANNVVIDHVSASWATDEVIDIHRSTNVTVQWSIIAEGLRDSTHTEGPHSMGLLIAGNGDVSIHHNLLAHNRERNPRISGCRTCDIVNNVIYDAHATTMVVSSDFGPSNINYTNNYIKPGPTFTTEAVYPAAITGQSGIFAAGNFFEGQDYANGEDQNAVRPSDRSLIVAQPYDAPPVTTLTAHAAYEQVLAKAGASYPRRDAVDERLVRNVLDGAGGNVNNPDEVGGWPTLSSGAPYADSDHDGISDEYERTHGLNPDDPADGPVDDDGDGYTHLEEFLNALATGVPAG